MSSIALARIDDALAALAPGGYSCALHIRFSRPVRRVSNYASDWLQAYTRQNMGVGDPMVIWCMMNEGSIRWSALTATMPDPMNVMGKARDHGLVHGVAVSHGPALSRSYLGAAHPTRDFTDAEIARFSALLAEAHAVMDHATALRPILVDALEAIACGMTYDQACAALGISRTALRYRLATARDAIGAPDNATAIRKAIDLGLLSSNSVAGLVRGLPSGPD